MRSAPRGSVPWAQGTTAYFQGTMASARIGDLLAAIALLRTVDPAPEAVGKMALLFLAGIYILDAFGQIPEGTALGERFSTVVRSTGDRESMTVFWWNVVFGVRAAHAHDDPSDALRHVDAIQPIFDVIGGQLIALNMQMFRGLNLWYMGAFALAEPALKEAVAADESLGMVSSWRRFSLSWLLADRGALDEARVLATQLTDYGHAHHVPLDEGKGRWVLAEVLRRLGDLEGAEREVQLALGMVVPLDHPGVLGTLAFLRLAQGRPEEALAAAAEATDRGSVIGGCGMFRGAFVRLAHAEALHATGAHDAARRAIAEARAHLFAIADRIADPVFERSFLESVPENARILELARAWVGEPAPRR